MEPSGNISGTEKVALNAMRRVFRRLINRVDANNKEEEEFLENKIQETSVTQAQHQQQIAYHNMEKKTEKAETRNSVLQEISVREQILNAEKKLKRARDLDEKQEELEILAKQIELRAKLVELKERKLVRKEKELELREELLELSKKTGGNSDFRGGASSLKLLDSANHQPESVGLRKKIHAHAKNSSAIYKFCQCTRPIKNRKIASGDLLEVDIPASSWMKTLKIEFHSAKKDEVEIIRVSLPNQSTVGDLLNKIKTMVELSKPDAELRLVEVYLHKLCKVKISHLCEKIENINDQKGRIRAEEIPDEEKNLGPRDILICVYHFTLRTTLHRQRIQNFGEPFFLVIHESETLAEIKPRIQKRLQVPYEEFSKWKFAFVVFGGFPEYLQDTDDIFKRFQWRASTGSFVQYLGLEHSDTTPPQKAIVPESSCL
ncbi:OLC1v1000643C1 [Oldenlandia corymbosa var. corymbosa]|uniref:ubiquitinyl hydrolase 1 n=1 Tax=Oldenlandia corymbosa var. corymbosa TaxID=529605 RepID=A0AAV1D4W7_OLDCO|nr:OLC1v1000643C1 [Oldenlandia corymbosa var. corymbosa]